MLVVIQLPGAWMLFGIAVVIELIDGLWFSRDTWTFPLWLLIANLVLLVIGEIVEFAAGAAGAKGGGASRRGMIGSLIGGVVGIFVFTPLFFWLPFFGTLMGAIVGTFVGAVIGELSAEGTRVGHTVKPAIGATIGRVVGTMSKVGVALVLWLSLSVAAFWPA